MDLQRTPSDFHDVNQKLAFHIGTEHYYKHLSGFVYTDGIKDLVQQYRCAWLVDDIMISIRFKKLSVHPFILIFFRRIMIEKPGGNIERAKSFRLTMEDGNGKVLLIEKIPSSDFVGDELQLYFCDGVLLLTSEY